MSELPFFSGIMKAEKKALKLALKALRSERQKYAQQANLYKDYKLESCKALAEHYDDLSAAIELIESALKRVA